MTFSALLPSADGRSTMMRPVCVSLRMMSPLGATRIARAPGRSLANTSTLKPAGTESFALAGLSMNFGKLLADGVSYGAGSLARSTRCLRPGKSFFQSASPFTGPAAGGAGGGRNPAGGGASLKLPSFSA